jgi:hypothetical protein
MVTCPIPEKYQHTISVALKVLLQNCVKWGNKDGEKLVRATLAELQLKEALDERAQRPRQKRKSKPVKPKPKPPAEVAPSRIEIPLPRKEGHVNSSVHWHWCRNCRQRWEHANSATGCDRGYQLVCHDCNPN